MRSLMIKSCLVYVFLLYSLAYCVSVLAANNDIYLTQAGGGSTALTLSIDQIGSSNVVGTSSARVSLSGTSITADVDQIGDSNIIAMTAAQANSASFTLKSTGDSNTQTLALGATGDVQNTDFDFEATGDSNVLVYTQGNTATATAANADFSVTGTSNNINVACNVVGCVNDWTVDGDSNDIDTTQVNNADHSIKANITGNGNNIDVDQSSTGGSVKNILDIVAITTNGVIDVDQCTSGC
jgi:hypothetical protein